MNTKSTNTPAVTEWVRVKIKKSVHVAGAIAAPGAIVNVSKETADRLVTDGVGVILY